MEHFIISKNITDSYFYNRSVSWKFLGMFFAKSEKKFATLQCAAHVLSMYVPSVEHTLLKQVCISFFIFFFLE